MGIAGSARETRAWLWNARLSKPQLAPWEAAYRELADGLGEAIVENDELGQALLTGDPRRLNRNFAETIDAVARSFEAQISTVLMLGAEETDRELERAIAKQENSATVMVRFDLKNPRAQTWIAERGAELVTGITESTMLAIREAVLRSFRVGLPIPAATALIRSEVGLLPQHAMAVERFYGSQIAAGVPEATALAQASRYADRLRTYRARNIARTETIRASNEGRRLLWVEAENVGLLPRGSTREWVAATESPRTCPICLALDGSTAALGQPFEATGAGVSPLGPPAHPSCRCTTILSAATLAAAREMRIAA